MYVCPGDKIFSVVVRLTDDGTRVFREQWHNANGELEGPAGRPASISYNEETGNITFKKWYVNGKLHREDGPAIAFCDTDSGEEYPMSYHQNGEYHREDGPALIYDSDDHIPGTVTHVYYWHGKTHRADGPAKYTQHRKTGELFEVEYWIHGIKQDVDRSPKPR